MWSCQVSDESTYTPRNFVFSTCSTFLSSINSSLLNVIFCFLFLNIMKCVFSIFSDSLFVLSHSIILDISSFLLVTSLSGSFPDIKMLESSATRQIWGIWKLRPAYSPETPNLGQNGWCFVPCDLEIWWMTLEKNKASLLCCFKLCATFYSHWWIQTGVTVRKRPIWVKFDDF